MQDTTFMNLTLTEKEIEQGYFKLPRYFNHREYWNWIWLMIFQYYDYSNLIFFIKSITLFFGISQGFKNSDELVM